MTRMFLRSLWGAPRTEPVRMLRRRMTKMPRDLVGAWQCPYKFDFTVLTYGRDNTVACQECGFKTIQICDEPYAVDPLKNFYEHKLLAVQHAFDQLEATEVVYLDFDCCPIREVDDGIWTLLASKSAFQSPITKYARQLCPWRDASGARYLPNGGFCFFRGKDMARRLRKAYIASGSPANDEIALGWLADEMDGSWVNVEHYCEIHEPLVAECTYRGWCPQELAKKKTIYFAHSPFPADVAGA